MEPTKLSMEELIAQLEFYFSDVNLHTDKHLRELVMSDPSGSQFVSLAKLLLFRKISQNSTGELVQAIQSSDKLELSEDYESARPKVKFDPTKRIYQQIAYLFNPIDNSDHNTILKMLKNTQPSGVPLPVKVGCKRDNETGKCYGAKLYFSSEEFRRAFLSARNLLNADIDEEKNKENGMVTYEDYLRMINVQSEEKRGGLVLCSGLKGYDLKGQRNIIKTMIKHELLKQNVGLQNVMLHEKEVTSCLLIYVSEEKAAEAVKSLGFNSKGEQNADSPKILVDGVEITLRLLDKYEVEDIWKKITARKMKARMGRGRGVRGGRIGRRGGRGRMPSRGFRRGNGRKVFRGGDMRGRRPQFESRGRGRSFGDSRGRFFGGRSNRGYNMGNRGDGRGSF